MGGLQALASRTLALMIAVGVASGCEGKTKQPSRVQRTEAVFARTTASSTPAHVTTTRSQHTAKPRKKTICEHLVRGREFPDLAVGHAQARGAASVGDRIPVGGTWTWVNLWAAWCGPCKEELPRLLSWKRQLRGKLRVTFVSLDDDQRQLVRFLNEQPATGLRASFWLPEGKTQRRWLKQVGLPSPPDLPVQLLVDPSKRIRCVVRGSVEDSDLQRVRRIVGAR